MKKVSKIIAAVINKNIQKCMRNFWLSAGCTGFRKKI